MSELSRARLRELERIHILRTIIRLDEGSGAPGAQIAENANEECDHDALDGLPAISARGIGQKLNAMSLAGLVTADYDEEHRLHFWSVTDAGRELAERDPYDTAPPLAEAVEVDDELVRAAGDAFFQPGWNREPLTAMRRALEAAFALAADRSAGEGRA